MEYAWFAKSLRVVLAAVILVGSLGTSATYGHAHGRGTVDHHHHAANPSDHDHPDHDGQHLPSRDGDHEPLLALAAESAYHLHAVYFGIPFVVPSYAHFGHALHQSPSWDVCPTQLSSFDVERLLKLKERIPWQLPWALPPAVLDSDLRQDASRQVAVERSPEPWCAAHARSVILLC